MPKGEENYQGEENLGPPLRTPNSTPMPQGQMSNEYPPTGQTPDKPNNPNGLPVDQVINLRQQGLSNNQVVQTLQKDGYDSGQIFDALNQADMQGGAAGPAPNQGGFPPPGEMNQGMPPPPQNFSPPPPIEGSGNIPMFQQQNYRSQTLPPLEGMPHPPSKNTDVSKVEEIAEAIINEKWEEIIKRINKIIEWKEYSETRLNKMEQQFSDLKDNFDKLHKAIIGKIGEYDKNILGVGTEIKAMEKVFQKILPTFTENVSELSRITRNIKSSSSKLKTKSTR